MHARSMEANHWASLNEGAEVDFVAVQGDRGAEARNVRPASETDPLR